MAKVRLRFHDARAQLNHTEEWEAVLPVLGPELSWAEAMVVDHDPRDLRVEPPPWRSLRAQRRRLRSGHVLSHRP